MTATQPSSESSVNESQVMNWLSEVKYPGFNRDIVSFGLVDTIEIENDVVKVFLQITTGNKDIPPQIEKEVKDTLISKPGIRDVHVSMHVDQPKKTAQAAQKEMPKPVSIPGVDKVIAVASGKGGVGKSSVAAMLAMKANEMGLRTGILDLDIYGPSLPLMMGITDKPQFQDKMIIPELRYGIALMSIGFFIDESTPLIWRGPMVANAATQLLTEVKWDNLDLLVIDLPPGTGDAQLTLAQKAQLDGAIMVTTPQDLALVDAAKGALMFMRVGVTVLGIVENMSVFICPECGYKSYLFGKGGGKREAKKLNVPFLGEVPLDPMLREAVDTAKLDIILASDNPVNRAFTDIFTDISARLGVAPMDYKSSN
jgi:ATP-binding protein involved in chromosome partitioning